MPKCGACGWTFSDKTLARHSETPCGEEDVKAPVRKHQPEIDDIIKMIDEEEGEGDES
jgi:hypothetical protein